MNENISLLEAIVSTMDTIPIIGIDAQDKFVGCANAIRSVIRSLRADLVVLEQNGTAKDLTEQEEKEE